MDHFGTFIAIMTSVVTAVGLLATLTGHMQKIWEAKRRRTVLIACPPRVNIPDQLTGLKVFSSIRGAIDSGESKAVVFTSNISRALRSCDFVIVEPGCDPKLIVADSEIGKSKLSVIGNKGL